MSRQASELAPLGWGIGLFMAGCFLIIAVTGGCSGPAPEGDPSAGTSGILAPPGMDLPYVVEPACPGEGCAYGAWMACDSVSVFEVPDPDATPVAHLAADQSFVVQSGRVVVDVPEVVVVTRPIRPLGVSDEGTLFDRGDTLYVLDYLSEGFFNVWFADSIIEAEVFWPWDPFITGPEFEYGGQVIQPGQAAFWVRVTSGNAEGWVLADHPAILAANAIDPAPLVCY